MSMTVSLRLPSGSQTVVEPPMPELRRSSSEPLGEVTTQVASDPATLRGSATVPIGTAVDMEGLTQIVGTSTLTEPQHGKDVGGSSQPEGLAHTEPATRPKPTEASGPATLPNGGTLTPTGRDEAKAVNGGGRSDLAPPKDWTAKIAAYADGTKHSSRPGPNESRMNDLAAAFRAGAASKDADMRSFELSRTLAHGLHQTPLGSHDLIPRPPITSPRALLEWHQTSLSPRAKELRQAAMVAHTLWAGVEGLSTETTRADALRAVMLLSPADRQTLLQADRLSGNGLARLFHELKGNADPAIAELHRDFRAELGMADTHLKLDRIDPTGEASQTLARFMDDLDALGVSSEHQTGFKEHLAFQSRTNDFAPITGDRRDSIVHESRWRQAMTGDLMTRLGALEALPKSAAKPGAPLGLPDILLKLPAGDLKAVVAQALQRPTEGGQHVLRAARDLLSREPNALGPEAKPFLALMDKVERRAYDPAAFVKALEKGTPLASIETDLRAAFDAKVKATVGRLNNAFKECDEAVAKRLARPPAPPPLPPPTGSSPEAKANALRQGADTLARYDAEQASLRFFQGGDHIQAVTKEDVAALAERFGFDGLDAPGFSTIADLSGNVRGALTLNMEAVRQISTQIKAIRDPSSLKAGLADFVPVLPTAGKALENFHFLDSVVSDMAAMADQIRTKDKGFTLANTPIVVFDQSDGDGTSKHKMALFDRNKAYMDGLETRYADQGLKILRVSMRDISAAIKGTEIEGLFDTTGQNNLGYGGARNVGYMLGPLVAELAKTGLTLADVPKTELVSMLRQHALGPDAANVFMGDDTDYLRPGAMFAKVGANASHDGQYYLLFSQRNGRDTMGVSSAGFKMNEKQIEDEPTSVATRSYGAGRYNPDIKSPGMGSVTGGTRFCLNIPTGGEELQHNALTTFKDIFTRAVHLSGDRMKPLDRHAADTLNYALGTEMYKALTENAPILSWNNEASEKTKAWGAAFDSNRSVLSFAAERKGTTDRPLEAQVAFLGKLDGWLKLPGPFNPDGTNNTAGHEAGPLSFGETHAHRLEEAVRRNPDMDPELKEHYASVAATIRNVIAEGEVIKAFGTAFLAAIANGDTSPATLRRTLEADPKAAVEAFEKAKTAVLGTRDLSRPENQVIRDFTLIVQSLGTRGFTDLAAKLAA